MAVNYLNIFYIFLVLAIAFLLLAVFLFIKLNIPKVIGDLSGKTSQRAIKKTREQNKNTGKKEYKSSTVNAKRGKVTDKMNDKKQQRSANVAYADIKTDPIGMPEGTAVLASNDAPIYSADTTEVLADTQPEQATSVLSEAYGVSDSTTVLGNVVERVEGQEEFIIEEDISFTDSPEVIV